MAKNKLIVGLTGPLAGGKGVVAGYLEEKGFIHFSLSDRIREEIKKRKGKVTRKTLQDTADEMRRTGGPAVLLKRTLKLVEGHSGSYFVVETLRGQAEVDFLKKIPLSFLLGITAPAVVRFKRMMRRNRGGDLLNWPQFIAADRNDFKSGRGLMGRDINYCLSQADIVLENTSSLKDLYDQIDRWLVKIGK